VERPDPSPIRLDGRWRGADHATVVRVCAFAWLASAAGSAPFAAAFPPRPLGLGIAAVAVYVVVVAVAAVLAHRRPAAMTFPRIVAVFWFELAFYAVTQALAGGWAVPVYQLLGLRAMVVALCFPAPVAIPLVLGSLLITLSPVAYGATAGRIGDVGLFAVMWLGIATASLSAMSRVRARRVALGREAQVDALTGLGNRRALAAVAGDVVARHPVVALGLADVDRFKQVNDSFGHLAGDACLRAVAAALAAGCEPGGAAFRWAGDEFAAVVWAHDAAALDARCRAAEGAVDGAARDPVDRPIAVSFGWARLEPGRPLDVALGHADADLLQRKRDRRAGFAATVRPGRPAPAPA
jgi:diguanylate cyclase (GGDEF)-like protein